MTRSDRIVRIDRSIISITAIAPAAHAISDHCFVHLDDLDQTNSVRLVARSADIDLDVEAGRFANALIDHTLRERLRQETEPIRNLLVAQAFTHVDMLHPHDSEVAIDDSPPGTALPDRPHQRPIP